MKIKNLLTYLIVLAVALSACKKSDSGTGPTPTKKLKYLTQIITVNSTGNVFTNFTYDAQKRLAAASVNGSATNYVYNGNDLFSIEYTAAQGRNVTEFTYQDGKITSAHLKKYSGSTLLSDMVYNYLYVGDKITEIHHDIYVDLYTYDNNNNLAQVYFAQYSTTNKYTYDNKPSRFTNAATKAVMLSDFDRYSPNNVITSTLGSQSGTTTYTYNYDSDGYPTSGAAVNETTPSANAKYTYVYTEL